VGVVASGVAGRAGGGIGAVKCMMKRYRLYISPGRKSVLSLPNRRKQTRIRFAIMLIACLPLLAGTGVGANDESVEPFAFFHEYAGLSDDQIEALRNGKAIAKVLPSRIPDEVFVLGSVYVESTPEHYLKLASDIDAMRKLPGYVAIQRFSDPPQLSDLDGFTLTEEDVRQLKDCKPGHCELQLPTEAMEIFQRSVDWSAADKAEQVNRLARQMALEALSKYMQGGNSALGTYRDKSHPTEVAETFQSLLSWSKALPVYLPELQNYLLDYPKVKSGNFETRFYWEKVDFGLKPTLRIVQAIVFRSTRSTGPVFAVAQKQLYASHYFQSALDLTVCVKDSSRPNQAGFYLITLKGSQQAGLTGLRGGIVRKVAVDKTRSSLERALASVKQKLEARAN
jgi:hypothetical protein